MKGKVQTWYPNTVKSLPRDAQPWDRMDVLDPFSYSLAAMMDEGYTANRSLAETAKAFHAWRDRNPTR